MISALLVILLCGTASADTFTSAGGASATVSSLTVTGNGNACLKAGPLNVDCGTPSVTATSSVTANDIKAVYSLTAATATIPTLAGPVTVAQGTFSVTGQVGEAIQASNAGRTVRAGLGINNGGADNATGLYYNGAVVGSFDSNGGLALGTYAPATTPPANGLAVSGSVGVGTPNPATKLQMSSGTLTIDGNAQPHIAIGGGGITGQIRGIGALYLDTDNGTQNGVHLRPGSVETVNTHYNGAPFFKIGDSVQSEATTFDVNGSAQFGSGATKSTFTATGQLQVGGTGNSTFYGSTMTVANSGIISAPSQPGISVKRATSQNLANATTTNIFFGAQNWAQGGFALNGASSGTVTVPTGAGGIYLVTCGAGDFAANATGVRILYLYQNSTALTTSSAIGSAAAGQDLSVSALVSAAAADTFSCQAYQNSGGTLTIGADANGYNLLTAIKVW